jgi:hypothetical protein
MTNIMDLQEFRFADVVCSHGVLTWSADVVHIKQMNFT